MLVDFMDTVLVPRLHAKGSGSIEKNVPGEGEEQPLALTVLYLLRKPAAALQLPRMWACRRLAWPHWKSAPHLPRGRQPRLFSSCSSCLHLND